MIVTWALIAVVLVIYHLRRLKLYNAASKFSGPTVWPIIGNAHLALGDTQKVFETVFEFTKKFPSPMRLWLGHRLAFGVYEPEQIKTVFHKTMKKEDVYTTLECWMGKGLVTAPVSAWRKSRKMIEPSFNQRILDNFVALFDQQSNILMGKISNHLGGAEFEIAKYVGLCTLDMICETTMGVSMNVQITEDYEYLTCINTACEIIFARMTKVWLHPDVIFYRTKNGKDLRKCVKYLHDFTKKVIEKKRIQLSESTKDELNSKESTRKAFLDLLMELRHKGKLTEQDLLDEVNTMISAGSDTAAVTINYVLLMLAIHPEVQDKAYNEISDIYAQKSVDEKELTAEDISKMFYLERVIKETLRAFPSTPLFARQATEDFELDDKLVPAGSILGITAVNIHRNDKYWPDPLKFDPDRFLPEEVAKRHPYSYIPFSGGPRNCIGLRYAMMAIKVLVASILKEYILSKDKPMTVEDVKFKQEILLTPLDPIKFKIMRRSVH